jgi:hypothetical protein
MSVPFYLPMPIYRALERDRVRERIKGGLLFIEAGDMGCEVRPATLADRVRLARKAVVRWLDRVFP